MKAASGRSLSLLGATWKVQKNGLILGTGTGRSKEGDVDTEEKGKRPDRDSPGQRERGAAPGSQHREEPEGQNGSGRWPSGRCKPRPGRSQGLRWLEQHVQGKGTRSRLRQDQEIHVPPEGGQQPFQRAEGGHHHHEAHRRDPHPRKRTSMARTSTMKVGRTRSRA